VLSRRFNENSNSNSSNFSVQRRARSNAGTNGQLQTLLEENPEQPFSFPLYNGAAPSVPPRHQNQQNQHQNTPPSSAFKRLEQQQQIRIHQQQTQQQTQQFPQHQLQHQQQNQQHQQHNISNKINNTSNITRGIVNYISYF